MASSNLEGYFSIIETAEDGEQVRDAIINAAKNMNFIVNDSASLGGIKASVFATFIEYQPLRDKLIKMIQFDDIDAMANWDQTKDSENLMTSGNIYQIFVQYLNPSYKSIMHYENDPMDKMEALEAAEQYLTILEKLKADLGKALKSKGYMEQTPEGGYKYVTINPNDAIDFRHYYELIDKIGSGTPELVTETFTQNKEYDAGEGKAYSSFKVEISDMLVEGNFTTNHTQNTPPEGKLYKSPINVNVSGRSSYGAGSSRTGGGYGTTSEGLTDDNGMLSSKSITENGSYSASEDAVPGYASLEVHVEAPELDANTTFKVRFVQNKTDEDGMEYEEELCDPVTVVAYDSARYPGDEPTHEDANLVFSGWEPAPSIVMSNMTCVARFKPRPTEEGVEIQDDWATIVANRGEPYNPGDYKSLEIGEVDGVNYGTVAFMKVASGEDSSTSTWLAKHILANSSTYDYKFWPTSAAREFLNGRFFEIIKGTVDGGLIASNVIAVEKRTYTPYSEGGTLHTYPIIETTTYDSFWIPSAAEMVGPFPYEDYWEAELKYGYNGMKTDGTTIPMPNKDIKPSSVNNVPKFPPDPFFYESKGADYSEAHGGCTKSTVLDSNNNAQYNLEVTMTDASKYKKSLSTNHDAYQNYPLRSFERWHLSGQESQDHWHCITATGEYGDVRSGGGLVIGFCL